MSGVFGFMANIATRTSGGMVVSDSVVQLFPPLVLFRMPIPSNVLPPQPASPVPAYTTLVSTGLIARAPIDWVGKSSETENQFAPAFQVFQTPPSAAPI